MALLPLVAVGCSQLSVRVDVFDDTKRRVVEAATVLCRGIDDLEQRADGVSIRRAATELFASLERLFPRIFAGSETAFAAGIADVLKTALADRASDLQQLRERAWSLGAPHPAGVEPAFSVVTDPEVASALFQAASRDYDSLVESVSSQWRASVGANAKQIADAVVEWTPPEAVGMVPGFRENLQEFVETTLLRAVVVPNMAPAKEAGELAVRVEGMGMDNPDLARIVGAPDGQWNNVFNRVMAVTMLGNAEIAVRMVNPGVYQLKGVVFDPSQLTKATIDGLAKAVSIAAAVSGVPVSEAGSKSSGGARVVSRAAIDAENVSDTKQVQRQLEARRVAYVQLLEAARQAMAGGDEKAKSLGLAAITKAAEAIRDQVEAQ